MRFGGHERNEDEFLAFEQNFPRRREQPPQVLPARDLRLIEQQVVCPIFLHDPRAFGQRRFFAEKTAYVRSPNILIGNKGQRMAGRDGNDLAAKRWHEPTAVYVRQHNIVLARETS